jgi:hypothetical protein
VNVAFCVIAHNMHVLHMVVDTCWLNADDDEQIVGRIQCIF